MPPNSGFSGFNDDERFQGNYGGGIKYQASKWFGFRIDVRGLAGIGPRFGLPSGPPSLGIAYIPNGKILNGIQATAGLTLYLGHRGEGAPVHSPRTTAAASAAGTAADQSGRHQRQPDNRLSGRRSEA